MNKKNPFKKISVFFRKLFKGFSLPYDTTVFGISNPDSQGALAQSKSGDALQIVHVPTEKHSYNAYVYNIELNRILGYIESELAQNLLYVFGKGYCLDGKILERYGDGQDAPFGAYIRIYHSTEVMKPYLDDIVYLTDKL